jgi:metal-dependent hydrolase (beta-lactamase superfamily II)
VADGTRTHDHLDHNQGLYQLSYSHRAQRRIAAPRSAAFSRSQSSYDDAASAGFAGARHQAPSEGSRTAGSHHVAAKPRQTSRGSASAGSAGARHQAPE